MYSLIKFCDDGILQVCKFKQLSYRNNSLYGPYFGRKYVCDLLARNDDESKLLDISKNLLKGTPYVQIERLENYNLDISNVLRDDSLNDTVLSFPLEKNNQHSLQNSIDMLNNSENNATLPIVPIEKPSTISGVNINSSENNETLPIEPTEERSTISDVTINRSKYNETLPTEESSAISDVNINSSKNNETLPIVPTEKPSIISDVNINSSKNNETLPIVPTEKPSIISDVNINSSINNETLPIVRTEEPSITSDVNMNTPVMFNDNAESDISQLNVPRPKAKIISVEKVEPPININDVNKRCIDLKTLSKSKPAQVETLQIKNITEQVEVYFSNIDSNNESISYNDFENYEIVQFENNKYDIDNSVQNEDLKCFQDVITITNSFLSETNATSKNNKTEEVFNNIEFVFDPADNKDDLSYNNELRNNSLDSADSVKADQEDANDFTLNKSKNNESCTNDEDSLTHFDSTNDPSYKDESQNDSSNLEEADAIVSQKANRKKKRSKLKENMLLYSTNQNKQTLGELLKNPTKVEVDNSNDGQKKYTCAFCEKRLSGKITTHLFTVHKDLPEVQEIANLPKRTKGGVLNDLQKKRQELIAAIRKKGAFLHNCKASQNDTLEIPRRNQMNKPGKLVSDYRSCMKCQGFFAKSALQKHQNICLGKKKGTERNGLFYHNLTIGNIHPDANEYLRPIAAKLRSDEISQVCRNDQLIVSYANYQSFKFRTSPQHHKQIRSEMRLLARILIEMRKKSKEITDMKSIFDPAFCSMYIETANLMGKFNKKTGFLDAPATARDVGHLTSEICKLWIGQCVEEKIPQQKAAAEEFLYLHNLKFPLLISKTVAESQTRQDLLKGLTKLPSIEDIKTLRKYAKLINDSELDKLRKKYSFKSWLKLIESTVILILVLNRKRPGEISLLRTIVYENALEKIDSETNPALYSKLSKKAKLIADKYVRIITRGKKNAKTAPILLDEQMVESINLILKYRKEAGVPDNNPYVFGLPSQAAECKWAEASPLLAKYSEQCGAKIPSLLRGTKLRKHVATIGLSLNLTDGEVDDLSKFMGHDKTIHLNIYRQPVGTKDILMVSQWLEYAQGEGDDDIEYDGAADLSLEDVQKPRSKPLSRIKENVDILNDLENDILHRDKDSKSSKHQKWSDEAANLVKSEYLDRVRKKETISGSEINQFIRNHKCLHGRNAMGIRSFLQHILRKEKSNTTQTQPEPISTKRKRSASPNKSAKKKNTVPISIYTQFEQNIKEKTIPTQLECIKAYEKSPTLLRYSPQDLQSLVQKAISFDDNE